MSNNNGLAPEQYEITPMAPGKYKIQINTGSMWLDLGYRESMDQAVKALNEAKRALGVINE